MKANRITTIIPAQSIIRSGVAGQTYFYPIVRPIGSFVETQWGMREVIGHTEPEVVDITPDCPAYC